jgi:hypothetical protein
VRHDQQPQAAAQAEEHKTLFILRVVRIVDKPCALVRERRLRALKGYAVLARFASALRGSHSMRKVLMYTVYVHCIGCATRPEDGSCAV